MRPKAGFLVFILSFSLLAAGHALSEESAPLQARVERAEARVLEVMEAERLPGIAVAVLIDGELVWSDGFGYANLEHRVPVQPETRFRVGSISKSLTSAALGLLIEQGRLNLDKPVQIYVPSFPRKQYQFTPRQLAGHLSGIPHYNEEEFINTTRYTSVTAALDKFKDRPLLFEPGTQFHYSSFGWNLLAAVIEAAADKPFLEYMGEKVFQSLGLRHTVPDENFPIIPHRASQYGVIGGEVINAPAIDNSDAWAAGGFLSTAEDLVRFGQAMLKARLHRADTVALLWTAQQTTGGQNTGYGLGWEERKMAGLRALGHGGSHVGATADFWILPEEKMVIAILTNANSQQLPALADEIMQIFLR
jgi:serine beta-lactamase-like protein LACTB